MFQAMVNLWKRLLERRKPIEPAENEAPPLRLVSARTGPRATDSAFKARMDAEYAWGVAVKALCLR
jgi:hypothetical protein